MKKIIQTLLSFLFFSSTIAQQSISGQDHNLTFKLKITETAHPDSVALVWLLMPMEAGKTFETSLHTSFFPKSPDSAGFYQQTITLPDSVMGKSFEYAYRLANDKYDIERRFILERNKVLDRAESWGYADGLQSKVKATKMLFPVPDSPDEKAIFLKHYVGITTDGKPIKNLFPIAKTGYSTISIKNAVTAFLETLTEEQKTISFFPVESIEWRR